MTSGGLDKAFLVLVVLGEIVPSPAFAKVNGKIAKPFGSAPILPAFIV